MKERALEGLESCGALPRDCRLRRDRGWASPTAFPGRGAEPVLQLLPQPVIDTNGLLQALAQVPDLTKMLFQQVGPCSHPRTRQKLERWLPG